MNASHHSSVIFSKPSGFARSIVTLLGAVLQRSTLSLAQSPDGQRDEVQELDGSELLRYDSRDRLAGIHCERGTLWITEENDGRDILLAAGQSYLPKGRGGLVLVQALRRSRMIAKFH